MAMPALAPPLRPLSDDDEDVLGDGREAGEVTPPAGTEEAVVDGFELDVPSVAEGDAADVAGAMDLLI